MLAKLEGARLGRSMEGERRIVTMLFCDVKGSTAMAETLDPEEWAEIMNGAFELLIAPVYRYEGTLARLMGDAIFAFFGAPIAHEDDPERAIAAGLEIVNGITGYRERLIADRGSGPERPRRDQHGSGRGRPGRFGPPARIHRDGRRRERRGADGADGRTRDRADHGRNAPAVDQLFDVESRGEIEVKGKVEPVEAYRVRGGSCPPGADTRTSARSASRSSGGRVS